MSAVPGSALAAHQPIDFAALPPASRTTLDLVVAPTADGRDLAVPAVVLAGTAPRPRLVCVAGVHGNEYDGIAALAGAARDLDPAALAGTVVLVPVANPPAFRARCRRNPDDGVDLNRVFPGVPDGTVSERLAHHLFERVVAGADFVLSLHGWTSGALVVPYTEYPRESPVSGASRAAARAFGLPYVEAFDWPPGLLVAACGRAGIPAIEPEVGGLDCTLPERRDLYRRGIRNLLIHLGIAAGRPELPPVVRRVTRTTVAAPAGGMVHRHVELGDGVEAGQPVATITDLVGEPLAVLRAPAAGFVGAQLLAAAVNPGEAVAVIFHPHAD